MERSNHDFTNPRSLGKNTFTNAFPVALANYMHSQRGLTIPVVTATMSSDGSIGRTHVRTSWRDIIGVDPAEAYYSFETIFDGYRPLTYGTPNQSDVVVIDSENRHCRPLEIKLVVVPTSGTASYDRSRQGCEIVVRPPSVEQLTFSIAHSFGEGRRHELSDLIAKILVHPSDYSWVDTRYMREKMPLIVEAARAVVRAGVSTQTPLFLIAEWRTEGQSPRLEENAFDAFVVTDLAFLTLFIGAANAASSRDGISRPERSLIWLIHSLLNWSTQSSLNFSHVHARFTYGSQTDKAGAFTHAARDLLMSPEFLYPRVLRDEMRKIVSPEALVELMPERRLDAALWIQSKIDSAVADKGQATNS